MKNKRDYPWLDENGEVYPLDRIKVISRNWDEQTWELYLSENVDVKRKSNQSFIEAFAHHEHQNENCEPCENKEVLELKQKLTRALEDIPEKEKLIIKLIFFENMRIREITKKFNMSKRTVIRLRDKGLSLLRKELSEPSKKETA